MFIKNKTGLELFSQEWPVTQPKAVVAIIHGQGEHVLRYTHVAQWFNQRGIACAGYDQQGFGQSGGKRGHAANLAAYTNDIADFLQIQREKYPNVPLFLYGHSMGGNVSLNYLLRTRPDFLAGAIITGPWIRLAFEAPKIKIVAGKMLRNIWPSLSLPSELDTTLLSTDAAVVAAYNADPLVHDRVSAAAGMALLEGAAWLNTYAGTPPCPLLLMHGGADGITSAPATKELAARLTGPVQHIEWPGMYHEIHNEPEKERVFAEILAFITQTTRVDTHLI